MKTFKMQIVNLLTSTFQHTRAVFIRNTYLAWLDRGLVVKNQFYVIPTPKTKSQNAY